MRDHILAVAERLFYTEGSKTVGVDRVIAEAGIAKATLYRHFQSKEELIEAYLTTRHLRGIAAIKAYLDEGETGPAAQILRLFDFLGERATAGGFRGCAFLIAVAENEASAGIRRIAAEHKRALRALLAERAVRITPDYDSLAEDIAICYEGALALIAVFRDAGAARAAHRTAKILIGHYATANARTPA